MNSSLSRRLLPWTLLFCLAIPAVILYLRAPKGDFEFDLSDSRVAESPAAPYYDRILEAVRNDPSHPVELILKFGLRKYRVRIVMETSRGITIDAMMFQPHGNGAIVNGEPVSLLIAAERMRHYCAAARTVSSTPMVPLYSPDGTMRQWAEFFRVVDLPGCWFVPSSF